MVTPRVKANTTTNAIGRWNAMATNVPKQEGVAGVGHICVDGDFDVLNLH